MSELPTLDTPEQIEALVRHFYGQVAQDVLLGPIFNDVAGVDWAAHIQTLTTFWSRALLDLPGYSGNPFAKHAAVHRREPFTAAHFNRWLELFTETIDEGWQGAKAAQAKSLARDVAAVHHTQLHRRHPIPLTE